jgi:hypothetical protein
MRKPGNTRSKLMPLFCFLLWTAKSFAAVATQPSPAETVLPGKTSTFYHGTIPSIIFASIITAIGFPGYFIGKMTRRMIKM